MLGGRILTVDFARPTQHPSPLARARLKSRRRIYLQTHSSAEQKVPSEKELIVTTFRSQRLAVGAKHGPDPGSLISRPLTTEDREVHCRARA